MSAKPTADRLVRGFVVITLALLATGCGGGDSNEAATGDEGPIVFAVVGPLTGENAAYGTNLENGVRLAVDEINEKGGIDGREVEIKTFDDKCDATEAATVAQRVAQDESIFAVMGPVCSSAALAALPIYQRAGLSVLSGSTTSPQLTEEAFDNFSRTIPSDTAQGQDMARLAIDILDAQSVATLYASDDYAQPINAVVETEIGELGATLTTAETYTPSSTKDFTPQLTKIANDDVDALLMIGYFSDMGTMVSQLGRVGLEEVTLIGSAGIAQDDYVKLGGDATEGSIIFSYYDPDNPLPANQELVKRFEDEYGDLPNEQSAFGYELPFIYKQAIEDGAEQENLTEFVRKVTFEGPTGVTKFDENGDVVGKAGVVLTVTDGELKLDTELTEQVNAAS
jgi:branched-chain amino acid transport system substrate-binding protein